MKLHFWKTVSGFFFCVGLTALGGAGAGAELGCSTSTSGGSSGGGSGSSGGGSGSTSGGVVRVAPGAGDIPTGCSADPTLTCDVDALGITCPTGTSPDDPTLVCSDPTPNANGDGFCCITWVATSTCTVDTAVTAACVYPSYGFTCTGSDTPDQADGSLTCSQDQGTGEFCCVDAYTGSGGSSGSSSGGPVLAGCNADSSVDCTGSGADGYSCASGDNPEAEDPTLSCSIPTTDPASGNDLYCCFAWSYGTTTCAPDDTITCPDPNSYGYSCDSPTDAPTSLDSGLTCSDGVDAGDGVHTNFCCTY